MRYGFRLLKNSWTKLKLSNKKIFKMMSANAEQGTKRLWWWIHVLNMSSSIIFMAWGDAINHWKTNKKLLSDNLMLLGYAKPLQVGISWGTMADDPYFKGISFNHLQPHLTAKEIEKKKSFEGHFFICWVLQFDII